MQKGIWHHLSIKEVFEEIGTGPKGITVEEAKERIRRNGRNVLPRKEALTRLKIVFAQIKSPLIYILFVAGIITFALGDHTDSIIIFIAVFLNTVVGYLQESKANEALGKLKKALHFKVVCLRGGQEYEIMQEDVVVGDVVSLRSGSKVPADGRIIEAHNLKVNEAVLTGEWLASDKSEEIAPEGAVLADRHNMVYMGTIVADGWGRAVIVETGQGTELGKIAKKIGEEKEEETPYQKKLLRLSKVIGFVVLCISSIIFIEGMLTNRQFVEMFTTSVAVAVAAIPEGLAVAMTVVLALGMRRLLKRKGLVRRLASAEALGTTSVILTDKTGTLTEAKMKVAGIFSGRDELLGSTEVLGELLAGEIHTISEELGRHRFALEIGALCNESFVENESDPIENWIVRGRPTEKPLFTEAIRAGVPVSKLREENKMIDKVLFDPVMKFAVSLHASKSEIHSLYFVGSPEKILEMSSYVYIHGEPKKMFLGDLKKIKEKHEVLTNHGYRVVAVAYRKTREDKIDAKEEEKNKRLVFVGFFALHDPIRKKVNKTMQDCRRAGMRPIIVTGDHKQTALIVARKLGFKTEAKNVLEGKDLDKMSDVDFKKRFRDVQVYARVEPSQKMRIVKAWQQAGHVVAMTGDGINDAPALKQADIGVALGSGTDVAKEVSDLILLEDDFRIIKAAVEEGRSIVDNIRKIITYLLASSFSEVILVSAGLFFGLPLPVLAGQILWVNLIEDGPLSICLAFEKKEKDIMKRKPRDYSLSLLTKEMKFLIFVVGIVTDVFLLGMFVLLIRYSGYTIAHIRTIIFAGLTIDSLFYIFSCKSLRRSLWHIDFFSNKLLLAAWASGVIMLVVAIYLPFLQDILRTISLNLVDWMIICGIGLLKLILIELTKAYFIRHH